MRRVGSSNTAHYPFQLSDKYDRERLAMSSSASGLRGKERDSAPHLASAVPTRAGQVQGSSLAARRAEGRDPAKRKIGESNEDWRRGETIVESARTVIDVNAGPDARPGKDGGMFVVSIAKYNHVDLMPRF